MLASFAAADNVKYANQMLVPEESGKPASVTLKLASPYIISGRSIGVAEGSDKIEVSTNAGKTFKRVKIDQIGTAAKGKLEAWVRITFSKALRSLNLSVDVQNNPGALPYLSPGKNIVSVGALQPKRHRRQPPGRYLRLSARLARQVVRRALRGREGNRQAT